MEMDPAPKMDPDTSTGRLARSSGGDGDATGWFDELYTAAGRGDAVVPWDRGRPSQLLEEWAGDRELRGDGQRACVVGSGYGRDAEFVARLGFDTVAFDISPAAIEQTRERFPHSPVGYHVADLLDLPGEWLGAFDLVVEDMNVQALPDPPRADAIAAVGPLVAPAGTLLVVAFGPAGEEPSADGPPWPLARREIEAFATGDLQTVSIEDLPDAEDPAVHRWRAEFRRTGA
ncbi:MAG TPA: methyltransferase domain-containing protein [Segeticoccus sp.]|jgi:SAM-dependent methyltransferase|nr:methyltransferase domain-containing protein [Segeticoccus sp.]